MIDKTYLLTVLRSNGVTLESSDEQIRSVLSAICSTTEEVDTALECVKKIRCENLTRQTTGLHKVFRSDLGLKPSEISQLLGVDVVITNTLAVKLKPPQLTLSRSVVVLLVASTIVAICTVTYMLSTRTGFFYHTTNLVFNDNATS